MTVGAKVGRSAAYYAASTVSLSPIALVTANSVDKRGLPRTDKAR